LAVDVITVTEVARLRRLRFRCQIEAIRADCVDAVLDGRLQHRAPAAEYLAALDLVAACARWATLAAVESAVPGLLTDGDLRELTANYRDLTAAEQYIIGQTQARVRAAIRSYLIWPLVPKPANLNVPYMRQAGQGRRP
jgi:hypothetical protein